VQPSSVVVSKPPQIGSILNHLPYTILIAKHDAARYCCLAMSIRKQIHANNNNNNNNNNNDTVHSKYSLASLLHGSILHYLVA
jgi:hypothetical protein